MRYAVLIDAGFLKRKLGSQKNPTTAQNICSFANSLIHHPVLEEHTLHRIYYYDAPPLDKEIPKPLNGGRINFGATPLARANTKILHALSREPYFALRLGEIAFRGWGIRNAQLQGNSESINVTSEDLRPDIQQKGVDMRIGLDIASLTLKKQVEIIVLVTGDSDFVPAMKFARREGAQLFLVALGHAVKDPLFEHSDLTLEIPDIPQIPTI